jgi:hypothetical protein
MPRKRERMRDCKTQLCAMRASTRSAILIAVCAMTAFSCAPARAQDPTPASDANKASNAEVKPLDGSLHAGVGEPSKPDWPDKDISGAHTRASSYSRWGFQPATTVFWPKQTAAPTETEPAGGAKNPSSVTDYTSKAGRIAPEHRSWQEKATGLKASLPDSGKEETTKQLGNHSSRFALEPNEDQTQDRPKIATFPHTAVQTVPQQPQPDSALKAFQEKPFGQSAIFSSAHPSPGYADLGGKKEPLAKGSKRSLHKKPNGPTQPNRGTL